MPPGWAGYAAVKQHSICNCLIKYTNEPDSSCKNFHRRVTVVPPGSCPLPLPSSSSCSQQAGADSPTISPPPSCFSFLTSKCQHISLNRDHRFTGAPKLTRSIIRVMIILIRWGAAPQGERCAINYTLAFWVNWLSDRVHFSLSSWMFFSRVVIQSPWRNPKTQNGSVSRGTLWRHLDRCHYGKGWRHGDLYMVLRGDCTCSSVKSNCIIFWKGIIAQCELLHREKKPWHYQP